ncbi:endonuclease domain-containing protein [Microbacterium sp. NPDC055312]
MDLFEELRRRGGITRTRTLRDAGVTEHAIRRAKADGAVIRPRNGWVALPDADWFALAVVRRGLVISCVSLAERRGLWVPERHQRHVVASPHSSRFSVPEHAVVHWAEPVIPREPDAVEDDLRNALVLVARCQPLETALVIWESALNKDLIDRASMARLDLPAAARQVLDRARPFADSGLETIIIHRLQWLRLPMLAQAWLYGHRVDLLIGKRLVVQLDGATHAGPQRTSDIAHDALLALHGFHVLRFSYEQVMDQWEQVQAVITEAVAQGLHLADR